MAFDKIVDSVQLNGAIKNTADAIREKTGETGEILWDLDNGFTEVISAILTGGGGGGGLPEGIAAIASGTFTPASNIITNYTVTHNLGVKPQFAVIMLCDNVSNNTIKGTLLFQGMMHKAHKDNTGTTAYMRGMTVYLNTSGNISNSTFNSLDESYASNTEAVFKGLSTYPLKAGCTYRWVCIAANDIE